MGGDQASGFYQVTVDAFQFTPPRGGDAAFGYILRARPIFQFTPRVGGDRPISV